MHLADISHAAYLESGLGDSVAAIAREEAGDAEVWITGSPHVLPALVP